MVKVIVLAACLVIAPPLAAIGFAGVGNPIWAEVLQGPTVPLSLFCTPGGHGAPFTEARSFGGGYNDATLEIRFLADYSLPLAGIPAQDIWIETAGSALVPCGGPLVPDGPTDAEGRTTWSRPLAVGGQFVSDPLDHLVIVINGDWASLSRTMDMRFNSTDLDGDGLVDLTDAGFFTMDLHGPYAYRSDFNWDGAINVSDAGFLAGGLGDHCP